MKKILLFLYLSCLVNLQAGESSALTQAEQKKIVDFARFAKAFTTIPHEAVASEQVGKIFSMAELSTWYAFLHNHKNEDLAAKVDCSTKQISRLKNIFNDAAIRAIAREMGKKTDDFDHATFLAQAREKLAAINIRIHATDLNNEHSYSHVVLYPDGLTKFYFNVQEAIFSDAIEVNEEEFLLAVNDSISCDLTIEIYAASLPFGITTNELTRSFSKLMCTVQSKMKEDENQDIVSKIRFRYKSEPYLKFTQEVYYTGEQCLPNDVDFMWFASLVRTPFFQTLELPAEFINKSQDKNSHIQGSFKALAESNVFRRIFVQELMSTKGSCRDLDVPGFKKGLKGAFYGQDVYDRINIF